jgi:hypothetical protein
VKRVYYERVFAGLWATVPAGFGLALMVVFIYGKYFSNYEDKSSAWFFLAVSLFLFLVAINFSFLNITVSSDAVTTRFGVISHRVPVDNIAGSYQDKTPKTAYKGFGVRWGSVNGKRRMVYDVSDMPRVVIRQKQNNNREFAFSTNNPDAVIKAIRSVTKQKSI